MKSVMQIFGVLSITAGVVVLLNANSAIHEILGSQQIGFGFVFLGIYGIISAIEGKKQKTEKEKK